MKIHLVTYAKGQPYETTQKLINDSIENYSKNEIIKHDYNFEKIKKCNWFKNIEHLPKLQRQGGWDGYRDGYYNAWKSFITLDVYNLIDEDDILYYVDSSRYHINGFEHNIDKLCNIVKQKGIIAGSVGNDVKNNSFNCCDNLHVWNKIINDNDNNKFLDKMHVLNSWFIMTKNEMNNIFLNEWVKFSIEDNLITYHHTADQSIFNILVIKFNLPVFYHQNITHDMNKDRNKILKILNENTEADQFFINLNI